MDIKVIARYILAVLAGVLAGYIINMGLIQASGSIIPPPEGADMTTVEGINAALPLLQPIHFLIPFLAHALGTLVGACVAAAIAPNHKMRVAFGMGFWFLLGGIAASTMIPAPTWFIIVDLVLAYIPMAIIGGKIGSSFGMSNRP